MFTYRKHLEFFKMLPDESTREFEVKLTQFAYVHASVKDQEILKQIASKEERDVAYAAFYCLTIIFRNQKNYEKLHAILNEYEAKFCSHMSYKHLKNLYLLESDALYDYDALLEDEYASYHFMKNNAGYVHSFSFAFAGICEKQGGALAEDTIAKWYEKALEAVNLAIELDQNYAKYYCTKARILTIGGNYFDAISLINHAISIEKSTRSDYVLRIGEYQYYKLYIQMQQMFFTQDGMNHRRERVMEKEELIENNLGPDISEGISENNFLFVSYSHKDNPKVHNIIQRLQSIGVKVWYDKGLPVGPSYFDELAKHIDSCDTMLLLLSNNSVNSQYVRKELCYALGKKPPKKVIHANIDGVILPSGVQLQIGDLQGISIADYHNDFELFAKKLVDEVYMQMKDVCEGTK